MIYTIISTCFNHLHIYLRYIRKESVYVKKLTIMLTVSAFALSVLMTGCGTSRWYKGVTHLHTLWSDGDQLPELAVNWYKTNGYAFVAVSDHNTLLRGEKWKDVTALDAKYKIVAESSRLFGPATVRTLQADGRTTIRLTTMDELVGMFSGCKDFILIDNQEITAKSNVASTNNVHLNAVNLHDNVSVYNGGTTESCAVENVERARSLAGKGRDPVHLHLNHPNWTHSHSAEEMARIIDIDSFELFNGGGYSHNLGDSFSASCERAWDIATTIRLTKQQTRPFYAVATDDAHNYHSISGACPPGRGWIMVRAKRLEANELVMAMNRGDFYASTGVELGAIDYDSEKGVISLEVKAKEGVEYSIEFIGTLKNAVIEPHEKFMNDNKGRPIKVTGVYSPEIGKVLKTVKSARAEYKLTGEELYVRVAVRSSVLVPDSKEKENYQSAWTQPYGWEKLLKINK